MPVLILFCLKKFYRTAIKKYPLDIIQITLDGQKERHNHLRSLKKSLKPTFDIIVSNIKNIVRELTTTKIHIRVNIDKTNLDDFFIVKKFIETEVGSSNIIVYPGIIRLENDSKTNLVEPSFSRWETAELLFNLFSNGDLNGSIYPTLHKAKTCCAMCVNSFIIGPYGEIYKCWNDVSDETKIVGYINDPKIKNPQIFYRYHTACAWYNDKECRDCFFLPICNGKCAWYGERNLFHGGKYNLCQCMQKAPDLLNNCLEAYYNKITKS
ncbi:SPASM domain-containing protein [Duncaniella dubosii]|uniref:SPASM domain-containing protein n=1 Tax=Duncaniella dubosii TaxID=2518971 RepID=A0A4P7W463_9BACT|nr:SPASM domain-containing protein [Duncaniella dubosii]QCD42220.1 SPASM domain-containing protein [Duncaniella dubosii]